MNFDFELFKRTTCDKAGLLLFKSLEEYKCFAKCLIEMNINASYFVRMIGDKIDDHGVFWRSDVAEIWSACIKEYHKTYIISDFALVNFISSEKDLLEFLKI